MLHMFTIEAVSIRLKAFAPFGPLWQWRGLRHGLSAGLGQRLRGEGVIVEIWLGFSLG